MSLLIAVIAHPALQHVLATQFTQAQASAEQNGCHAELASGFKAPHLSHQNFYMKLPKYSEIWSVSQVNYLKVQAAVSGISQAKDCKLGSSKPAHRQVLQLSEWMKQISKSLCHLKDYRQKMTKEPTCASSSSPPVDCSFNQVCLEFARNSPKPPAETTRMTSEGAGRLGSNPPQPTCGAAAQPSCDLLIRQLFTVEIIQWRHLRFQPTGPHVLRKKKKNTLWVWEWWEKPRSIPIIWSKKMPPDFQLPVLHEVLGLLFGISSLTAVEDCDLSCEKVLAV